MYVCVCILIYEICIGYKTAHISYWHDIIMMIGVYCSFVNLKYVFKTQNVLFFLSGNTNSMQIWIKRLPNS